MLRLKFAPLLGSYCTKGDFPFNWRACAPLAFWLFLLLYKRASYMTLKIQQENGEREGTILGKRRCVEGAYRSWSRLVAGAETADANLFEAVSSCCILEPKFAQGEGRYPYCNHQIRIEIWSEQILRRIPGHFRPNLGSSFVLNSLASSEDEEPESKIWSQGWNCAKLLEIYYLRLLQMRCKSKQ